MTSQLVKAPGIARAGVCVRRDHTLEVGFVTVQGAVERGLGEVGPGDGRGRVGGRDRCGILPVQQVRLGLVVAGKQGGRGSEQISK